MAFIFGYSNLVVGNGSTSNDVNMTADWIVVDDGSGNTLRVPMTTTVTINKNIDQTSTLPNYRDEAGAANPTAWYSKWINIWAIYNPITNTMAGLFSLSSTAPTLPSGYTHKAWVGAVYNDSSGNFGTFIQNGNSVACPKVATAQTTAVSPPTEIPLAAFVPPTAKKVIGTLYVFESANTPSPVAYLFSDSAAAWTAGIVGTLSAGTNTGAAAYGYFSCPLFTPQKMWLTVHATTSTAYAWVTGWEY